MFKSIFQGKCCICKCAIPLDDLFCHECLKDITKLDTFCKVCGYPISADGANCKRCDTGMMKNIKKTYSLFHYSGSIRTLLLDIKFNYNISAIRNLHKYIQLPHLPDDYHYIIAVPSHPLRRLRRFIHPADILAKHIANTNNIELSNSLKRTKYTDFQYKHNSKDRKKNVKGAFTCTISLKNKNILLVDDILTTGNTLNECARILKSSGVKRVDCITLATD